MSAAQPLPTNKSSNTGSSRRDIGSGHFRTVTTREPFDVHAASSRWRRASRPRDRARLRSSMNSSRFLAIFSLAVGIALAVALTSIADAVLFRPLPVTRPAEIVRIYSASPLHTLGFVSYPDYKDFALGARTLSGLVAQTQVLLAFGARTGEPPEVRMGLAVTPNYFDVLGVSARLGRAFRATEDRDSVVVLADAFWRKRCGGDRSIVGRTIELDC